MSDGFIGRIIEWQQTKGKEKLFPLYVQVSCDLIIKHSTQYLI